MNALLRVIEGNSTYLAVRSWMHEPKHCSVTMLYCIRKSRNVFKSLSVVLAAIEIRSKKLGASKKPLNRSFSVDFK